MVREVSPFSLAEYVQMAFMGQHTLIIEMQTEHASGSISVRDGEPWAADYDAQRGVQAFCSMVNAGDCVIHVCRWSGPAGPRELFHDCQELLMRAALQRDEARRLGELFSEGLQAVVAGDYRRAATVLKQARDLDPDNAHVLHQLKRLAALGHGAPAPGTSHPLGCAPIIDVGDPWAGDEDVHTRTGCSP